jgi:GT2 family glycosyltransferase
MPEGSRIAMVRSMDVTSNLNTIIRDMFEGEWLWIMGDDHVFNQDCLIRLLDHEVDAVAPICAKKTPPWNFVSFKAEEERVHDVDGKVYPHYDFVEPSDVPDHGLMQVHAVGSAGLLVRRPVIEAIGDPWFENSRGTVINDDLEFCRKVREAGYKIHVDVDTAIGHIGHYTVVPERREGRWGVSLDFGGKGVNKIFLAAGGGQDG